MMSAQSFRLIAGAALSVTVALAGCAQTGAPQQTMLPDASSAISKPGICVSGAGAQPLTKLSALAPARVPIQPRKPNAAKRPQELLYVLEDITSTSSSVVVYDAYAPNPKVIRTAGNVGADAGSIWTDDRGNVYVGSGSSSLNSSVSVYAPGMSGKPIRTYTKAIGLPFGGAVDAKGTMYVSDGGLAGQTQGDIAVFPPGKLKPSQIKYYNVFIPHGLAVDAKRDIFVAQIYGLHRTFVTEFPHDAYQGINLHLNDLKGGYLLGLALDSHNDIVVADECNQAIRFYPPPYKDESKALTSGVITPTSVAYAPNGSLFVGNQFITNYGNVVVFPAGAMTPSETISTGITGQVLGVAIGPP
jgi:hypothetical protein